MAKNKKTKLVTGLACAVPAVIAVPTLLATVTSCKSNEGTTHIDFSEGTKKKQAVAYFDSTVTYTFLLKNINNPDVVQISLPMLKIDGKEVEDTEKRLMYTAVAKSNGTVILTFNLERVRNYATSNDPSNTYKNIEVNFNVNMKSDELNETVSDMLLTLTVYDYEVTATKETNAHVTKSTDRATYGEDYVFQIGTDSKNFYFNDTGVNDNYLKIYIAGIQVDYTTWKEWVNKNTNDCEYKSAVVTIPGDYVLGKIEIELEAIPAYYDWNITGVDEHVLFSKDGTNWYHDITQCVAHPTHLTDIDLKVKLDQPSESQYWYIDSQSITIDGKSPAESTGVVFDRNTLHIPGKMVTGDIKLNATIAIATATLNITCDALDPESEITLEGDIAECYQYGGWVPAWGITGTIKPKKDGYHFTKFVLYNTDTQQEISGSSQYYNLETGELNIPADTLTSSIELKLNAELYEYHGTNTVHPGESHIKTVTPTETTIKYGQAYRVNVATWDSGTGEGWEIDPVNSIVTVNSVAVPQDSITYGHDYLEIKASYLMENYPQGATINVSLKSQGCKYAVLKPKLDESRGTSHITYNGEWGEKKATHGQPFSFSLEYDTCYRYDATKTTITSGTTTLVINDDYTVTQNASNPQIWDFVIKGEKILGDIQITAESTERSYTVRGTVATEAQEFVKFPNNETTFESIDGATYGTPYSLDIHTTEASIYVLDVPTVTVGGETLSTSDFTWTQKDTTTYTLTIPGDKVTGEINVLAKGHLSEYDVTRPDSEYIQTTTIYDQNTQTMVSPGEKMNAVHTYTITITAEPHCTFESEQLWDIKVGGSSIKTLAGFTGSISADKKTINVTLTQSYTQHLITDATVISAQAEATEYTVTVPSSVTGLTSFTSNKNPITHFDEYIGTATLDTGYTLIDPATETIPDSAWDVKDTSTQESVKSTWNAKFAKDEQSGTYILTIDELKIDRNFTVTVTPFLETYKLDTTGLKNVTLTSTPTPTYHQQLTIPFTPTTGSTLTTSDITVKVGDTTLVESDNKYRVDNGNIIIDAGVIDGDVVITGNTTFSITYGTTDNPWPGEITITNKAEKFAVGTQTAITMPFTVDSGASKCYLVDKIVKVNGTELPYSDEYYKFQVNSYNENTSQFEGTLILEPAALTGNITVEAITDTTTLKYSTSTLPETVCDGFYPKVDEPCIKDEFAEDASQHRYLKFTNQNCTVIADHAFVNVDSSSTTIPSSIYGIDFSDANCKIQSIGAYAFYNASNVIDLVFNTTQYNTLTTIDEHAFESSGIAKIKLSAETVNIGEYILKNCRSLYEIDLTAFTTVPSSSTFSTLAFMDINSISEQTKTIKVAAGTSSTWSARGDIRDLMNEGWLVQEA